MDCLHRHVEKVYQDERKMVQKCEDCGKELTIYFPADVHRYIKKHKEYFVQPFGKDYALYEKLYGK